MRLRLVKQAFDHPDYIFELKHEGFRALVHIACDEHSMPAISEKGS
jgi:hypothetical protein